MNAVAAEFGRSALNGVAAWWWEHREVPRATVARIAADMLWHGIRELLTPGRERER